MHILIIVIRVKLSAQDHLQTDPKILELEIFVYSRWTPESQQTSRFCIFYWNVLYSYFLLLFCTENLIIFLFLVNLRSIWNQMEKYTLYWNFRVQHLKVILNFISLAYIAHSTCNLNFRSTFEYVKPMH